jgi:hypothetical protein
MSTRTRAKACARACQGMHARTCARLRRPMTGSCSSTPRGRCCPLDPHASAPASAPASASASLSPSVSLPCCACCGTILLTSDHTSRRRTTQQRRSISARGFADGVWLGAASVAALNGRGHEVGQRCHRSDAAGDAVGFSWQQSAEDGRLGIGRGCARACVRACVRAWLPSRTSTAAAAASASVAGASIVTYTPHSKRTSCCRRGRGEPSPAVDVALGRAPVPVQMWAG